VINTVRPERSTGHGQAWDRLLAVEADIGQWVEDGVQLTNVHGKLERQGVAVPYRTLHRFAVERCGFGRTKSTVRVADGEPGMECQIDFGRLGMMHDPDTGRRRAVHALLFTAVHSRHMFVWLSFTQTLADVIAGCEAAWAWFDGIFKVLIPDNMKPIVLNADPINPSFSDGWLDYAQARGFGTDPARVRSPKDKAVASHCTSWGGFGQDSPLEAAAEVFDEAGVAWRRWFVELFVLVVCLVSDEESGVVPVLDCGGVDAELVGDFGWGEQAAVA